MFLRTETIQEKKLIGRRMRMSLSDNKTFELWKSFMPRRREIKNNLTNDLISMQVYLDSFELNYYNLDATFDKWAAV